MRPYIRNVAFGVAAILAMVSQKGVMAHAEPSYGNQPLTSSWKLVWSDEFDGELIDRTKWSYDLDCWGGGNAERQCFTDSPANARIEEGALLITARRERVTGPSLPERLRDPDTASETVSREYSSARLVTRGNAAWRYGRIEVRARLPRGQGVWPAIWMLPETSSYGGWAASGEIDIMEAVNLGVPCEDCASGVEDRVLGTLHYGAEWPNNHYSGSAVTLPDLAQGPHTYALEWSPQGMTWSVDGTPFACQTPAHWFTTSEVGQGRPAAPFDQPFHLILNVAVGGGLAERKNLGGVHPEVFPQSMIVDFVRVYEWAGEGDAPAPTGPCEPAYRGDSSTTGG
jgi:beta-glucanase (GH16 family)